MTVKELSDLLAKFNPETEVVLCDDNDFVLTVTDASERRVAVDNYTLVERKYYSEGSWSEDLQEEWDAGRTVLIIS